MYLFLFLAAVAVVAKAETTPSADDDYFLKLQTIINSCLTDINAPYETVTILYRIKMPRNENERCYLECVFKKMNMITEEGMFNPAAAMEHAKRIYKTSEDLENAIRMINACDRAVVTYEAAKFKCKLGYTLRKCLLGHRGKPNSFLRRRPYD